MILKDRYNLPVVENEEIASDQFAALMLLEDDLLYNHLEAYKKVIESTNAKVNLLDEHPDYKQQYYNLACFMVLIMINTQILLSYQEVRRNSVEDAQDVVEAMIENGLADTAKAYIL